MHPLRKRAAVTIPVILGIFFVCIFGFYFGIKAAFAEEISGGGQKRSEIERQISELERQAQQLDQSLAVVQTEKKTLANETKGLNTEVKRRELEIKRLNLALRKAALEITDRSGRIEILSEKIVKSKKVLGASLLFLYANDRNNALVILLKNKSLSDFFDSLHNLGKIQATIKETLLGFKDDRTLLEKEKNELQDFEEEQQQLKSLQEVERRFLAQKKKEKDDLLRLTKGKEDIFQKLLQSKKRDIASLKTQLFYLEKTGITAEDAVRTADLAAKRAGIRTAFLLALLEVETGKQFEDGVITVGTNLGTGNWQRDLYDCYINLGKRGAAESEKRAFFSITEGLGLDPDKMPVSRRPSYGCGGAMGPAQFLPTTWLRFATRVAALTGHNPANPWNTEDAFTAAAVFLADAGADSQTRAGEIAAAKTYLSGNPNCKKTICSYYSNRILSLSKEIDRIL